MMLFLALLLKFLMLAVNLPSFLILVLLITAFLSPSPITRLIMLSSPSLIVTLTYLTLTLPPLIFSVNVHFFPSNVTVICVISLSEVFYPLTRNLVLSAVLVLVVTHVVTLFHARPSPVLNLRTVLLIILTVSHLMLFIVFNVLYVTRQRKCGSFIHWALNSPLA
jgi:hypothetical protein